ncbi:MAG: hypothetical protein ACOX44_13755 [Limnochordia bacterium]|jgi:hypothetical protein
MKKHILFLTAMVLLFTLSVAAAPEGYVVDRMLWESDLEEETLDAFPSKTWSMISGPSLFPADIFFRVAKDPVGSGKTLLVPFYAPGEAGNAYICTPVMSAVDAEYLLYSFDFYMESAKIDARPNAGVYLFGVLDWPPHAEVYLQVPLNNVVLDEWAHYDWVVDVKANKNYLYRNGELVTERNFRNVGLDTSNFRVAIYGTTNNLNVYFDNVKLSVIKKAE